MSEFDLQGKIIIVTGGTNGLGLASATDFYKRGAHVIITARSTEKGNVAIQAIQKNSNHIGIIEYGIYDATDFKTIQKFVNWFQEKNLKLDVLLNNAGIAYPPYEVYHGIESTFLVNHLSHFYLTKLLLPILKSGPQGTRIVNVSSEAHELFTDKKILPLDYKKWNDIAHVAEKDFSGFPIYGWSKLANICFTRELSKRLGENSNIYVNANHPGAIASNITANTSLKDSFIVSYIVNPLLKIFFNNPQTGAQTQIYLSTSPEIQEKNIKGQYYVPNCKPFKIKDVYIDVEMDKQLWELSEILVNEIVAQF